MTSIKTLASALAILTGLVGSTACDSDDDNGHVAGSGGSASSTGGAGGSGPFEPPANPGKGGFWVTVSGEDLAGIGYGWNSSATTETPAFVDGWAVKFRHVIITVDKLRINSDPDRDEGNPQSVGALVASADGPWAIDASIGGDVIGKSGSADEKTVPIAAFAKQADGAAFDPKATYAFSYDLVEASANAQLVNLDAEGTELYEQARSKGWSMILAGTATYAGPAPDSGSAFASIPRQIDFTLGLRNPSSYLNCRNTDLAAVGGEFPRGIQPSSNGGTIVQITLHTDHAFWDTLNVEGTPLHFDSIAAQALGDGTADAPGVVTSDDLVDVDITGFETRDGQVLPARSLVSDYQAPAGQLRFDSNGTSFDEANSFLSYLAYSAASGGHLNADGECEVKNHFTP